MTPLLAVFLLAASPAQADARGARLDCRYAASQAPAAGERARTVFLPDDDLFAPPLADPREPRMSLTLARQDFTEGLIGAGGQFGLVGRRRPNGCNGVQLGIVGGVASQFDLDARDRDLLNTDFLAGLQLTARRGPASLRARFYHQSSHAGDEFLANHPEIVLVQFGVEAVDALVAIDWSGGRLYGGGGFLDFAFGQPDSGQWQAGVELRRRSRDGGARPVAGADVMALGSRGWRTTRSAVGGVEWASPGLIRRMRALLVFIDGFTPYGQRILRQRARRLGLQTQFDF